MNHVKSFFAVAVVSTAAFAFTLRPNDFNQDENKLMKMMMDGMREMMNMKMTQDPDQDFATMMKSHHQQAVDMAQYEVKNGKDTMLTGMANKMINDQKKEIDELNAFLKEHEVAVRDTKFEQHMHAAMDTMMAASKRILLTGNTDHDFAVLMMAHHQGAIEMSKGELQHGQHQRMKDMARKIIDAQQKEIGDLQAWHSKHRK